MMGCRPHGILLAFLLWRVAVGMLLDRPEDLVQVLAGTDLSDRQSNGNTLPQVKRPWGFNDWVPHTSGNLYSNKWWFHTHDTSFKGMKCSHQPSPWLGDWGYFSIMPDTSSEPSLSLHYSPKASTWRPYLFEAKLGKSQADAKDQRTLFQFAPTDHAAVARVTFPAGAEERAIQVNVPQGLASVNGSMIVGYTTAARGEKPDNFKMYFVMRTSKVPERTQSNNWCMPAPCDNPRLSFGPDAGVVEVRIATSLISVEQAAWNLRQQVGDKSFDDVVEEGRQVWSKALNRVHVEAQDAVQQKVFYTNLWKSMLFPRYIHEQDSSGKEIHYSPFNGQVGRGKLVTDSGFWDAYHTVYPLNSVVFPENLGHLMDGWVNAYQENRWMPQWPSPGNRASMVGTMADVSLADAIVKSEAGGFTFDRELAYQAIRKDAVDGSSNPLDTNGRKELSEYDRRGFVSEGFGGEGHYSLPTSSQMGRPETGAEGILIAGLAHQGSATAAVRNGMLNKVDSPSYPDIIGLGQSSREAGGSKAGGHSVWEYGRTETVARTLNNAVADAAVARAAAALGHKEEAMALSKRSRKASEALFNRESKFFQPKSYDGKWLPEFTPLAWRRGFTEGNAYHYRYYLPHNVELLQDMFDGHLCESIKADLEHTSPPSYMVGGYGFDIHEMIEHSKTAEQFGMYNHCNQPAHELLWVAKKAGCDDIADKYLRRVMDKLYTTEGWCGDEDNGEMASWYVLSALGIYSLEGGKDEMVLGSPAVRSASVRLPEGRGELEVVAKDQSRDNVYVQSVTWTPTGGSQEPVEGNVIKYSKLMRGGRLEFTMGSSPKAKEATPSSGAGMPRRGDEAAKEPEEPGAAEKKPSFLSPLP